MDIACDKHVKSTLALSNFDLLTLSKIYVKVLKKIEQQYSADNPVHSVI